MFSMIWLGLVGDFASNTLELDGGLSLFFFMANHIWNDDPPLPTLPYVHCISLHYITLYTEIILHAALGWVKTTNQ